MWIASPPQQRRRPHLRREIALRTKEIAQVLGGFVVDARDVVAPRCLRERRLRAAVTGSRAVDLIGGVVVDGPEQLAAGQVGEEAIDFAADLARPGADEARVLARDDTQRACLSDDERELVDRGVLRAALLEAHVGIE